MSGHTRCKAWKHPDHMNQHGGEKYQFINRFSSFARNTKVAMPTAPPSQLRDEGAHSQRKAAKQQGKDSPPPPYPAAPPIHKNCSWGAGAAGRVVTRLMGNSNIELRDAFRESSSITCNIQALSFHSQSSLYATQDQSSHLISAVKS